MPVNSDYDWIQLTSGEWLKGKLLSMSQNRLEFDSDKLDRLTLKWKDVRGVYTAHSMSVMLKDNTVAKGRLRMVDGKIIVGDNVSTELDAVISIARTAKRRIDLWFGNIAVGANLRSGNVDQRELTIDANLKRRTAKSTISLSYLSNYSEFESQQNANDRRFNASYDYRFARRWFVRPVQFEYYRDPFLNIDSRFTAGPGVGYIFIDRLTQTWYVVAGPAYQKTNFKDALPGQKESATTWAAFMNTGYSQEVTSYLDITFEYQLILMDSESGTATHHLMAALDVDLTRRLDLRLSTYWDRIENPQVQSDGSTPKSNDFRVVVGLNLEL